MEPRLLLTGAAVINEFMAANDDVLADEDGQFSDWIELHNPTTELADLTGYYLTDDAGDLARWALPPITLGPGEYRIVFASGKDRAVAGSELHTNFKLAAGGEYLALIEPNGMTVAHEYAPTYPPQSNEQSYGLIAGTMTASYLGVPTPGAANILINPNEQVVINEIMYHPNTTPTPNAPRDEWIELYNRHDQPVSLNGWRFVDGIDFTFGDLSIPAGGYVIVAADPSAFNAKYPSVTAEVVGPWTGQLSNSGEAVTLEDATGERIDRVRYADEGDWATRVRMSVGGTNGWEWVSDADGLGRSLELVNPQVTNNQGQNWRASATAQGTPGAANSVLDNDIAPMIADVTHFPLIPRPVDAVTVTAKLTDELLTGLSATVRYRVDGTTPFLSAMMFDDGLHNDGEAGDGLFAGVIPAHAAGTIIEFYVEAGDAGGNTRTWPAPAIVSGAPQQVTNMAYQVEAAVETNNQPFYRLIMTQAERARLDAITSNSGSNAQVHATFIAHDGVNTEVRHNIGLRMRGASSRNRTPRSYRLTFPTDTPWQGVTGFNLNTQFAHSQMIGGIFFREAGLAAEDGRAVQLRINGVNFMAPGMPASFPNSLFGSYAHLEKLDGDFVENHFPLDPQGNLYRVQNAGSPIFGYLGTDPAAYRTRYPKQTNEEADDYSDLANLFNVLNNTPDAQFAAAIAQVANIEQWMRWFAVNTFMDNGENSIFNGRTDDGTMFAGINDPRFVLIAHDMDTLFGEGDGSSGSTTASLFKMTQNGSPIARLFTVPQFAALYWNQLYELSQTVFAVENINALFDQYLGGWVPQAVVDRMKTWASARRTYILSQIPGQFTIGTNLPTDSGLPHYTGSGSLTINGAADMRLTRQVMVNGVPAVLNGMAGTWSITNGVAVGEVLLPTNAVWRFLDNGSDQGTAWRQPGFDDSAWPSGPGELGYGDGDEATVVSFGPNANNKYATTYFRTTFNIEDASAITALTMRLKYDDGAAVYLNGAEVFRSGNLPGNAAYNTYSNGSTPNENTFFEFTASGALVVDGLNTLAVEIHQSDGGSSDLSMAMEVSASSSLGGNTLGLTPGINRVRVEALDAVGNVVNRGEVDVWFDVQPATTVSGAISGNTIWSAGDGPYRVIGDVTVNAGATLTIEPGTTVYFDGGAGLIVRGRLVADGAFGSEIFLRPNPGGSAPWDGVIFDQTTQDNILRHVIMLNGDGRDAVITVDQSQLTIESSRWDATDRHIIDFDSATLTVRNSTVPGVSGNSAIVGTGIAPGGAVVIEGNTFGAMTGQGAAVRYSGTSLGAATPEHTLQIRGNQFSGGADDGVVVINARALIEGNTFASFNKNHGGAGSANAVLADGASHVTLARNLFHDNDVAVQVVGGSSAVIDSSTFARQAAAAISFDDPDLPVAPGVAAAIRDGIFHLNEATFAHVTEGVTNLTVDHSIIPAAEHGRGVNNFEADPLFVDLAGGDFDLKRGSPAEGRGVNGATIGATAPAGATVRGEPAPITWRPDATLTIGGAGLIAYRYRVNDGPLTAVSDIDTPMTLTGLTDGSYTVDVFGIDAAGVQQATATRSLTWSVDSGYAAVRINEVLARNQTIAFGGLTTDLIELHNAGPSEINLGGMSISDDPANPTKHVFAPGTTILPGQYLVLLADSRTTPGHVNFSLSADGEGVYLFDSGGGLLDSVEFGLQVTDLSIGRGADGAWGLNTPTFGAANVARNAGDPHRLKINEWLASGDFFISDDYIELYNDQPIPVDLSGLHLTDDPIHFPLRHAIAPLSFIAAGEYAVFIPDGNVENGPQHVNFRLNAFSESIGLFDANGQRIDAIQFGPQRVDVAQGRSPDGARPIVSFNIPNPGLPNPVVADTGTSYNIFTFADVWRYEDSGGNLGTAWREPGFNDAAWLSGPGLLGQEGSPLGEPLRTNVNLQPGKITFYFRKSFTYNGPTTGVTLDLSTYIDDGMVVYLNGVELLRHRMPTGTINFNTLANTFVGNASLETFVGLPADALVDGTNVIAIEVHQSDANNGDLVMGMKLDVHVPPIDPGSNNLQLLLDDLRITELMYHPVEGNEYEYIELQNTGGQTLDLTGVRFTNGIDFTFPPLLLEPGEYVVIASDMAAFRSKYGTAIPLAGQYSGQLSNGGENIELALPAPLEAAILDFTYSDLWYPTTDGGGFSLEMIDPSLPPVAWGDSANWRSSTAFNGSPGADNQTADPTPPAITQVRVGGSTWGDASLAAGYLVPVGSGAQLINLPWIGIDQVHVTFGEPVNVQQAHVTLIGLGGPVPISLLDYNPATLTATLTLASPLGRDHLTLVISDGVTDTTGHALDGEWDNPADPNDGASDTYPSGNGAAGGSFAFRFNTRPGDATGDDLLDHADLDAVIPGSVDPRHDLNADGVVDALDRDALVVDIMQTSYGDQNLDGRVNITDLGRLAVNFGRTGLGWAGGDFDGDGLVGIADLARLAVAFGFNNGLGGVGGGSAGDGGVDLLAEATPSTRQTVLRPIQLTAASSTDAAAATWRHIQSVLPGVE